MAALKGWVLTGLNVRNYGKLDKEIYMEQPEGFIVPGKENMVLRLRRALYGLKQAGVASPETIHGEARIYILELRCRIIPLQE